MDVQNKLLLERVKEESIGLLPNVLGELHEMARIGYLPYNQGAKEGEYEIYVNTNDSGNVPHFHIRLKEDWAKFHTCVEFKNPEYFIHGSKQDVLTGRLKRELIWFFEGTNKSGRTNWDEACSDWNKNNSSVTIPDGFEMPDYMKLSLVNLHGIQEIVQPEKKELPPDAHLYMEDVKEGRELFKRIEAFDEHYGFMKNYHNCTYEELFEAGYTPELGYTRQVYDEVYAKDNQMLGGYIIESVDDNIDIIVPVIRPWMEGRDDVRYLLEKTEYYIESGTRMLKKVYQDEYLTERPKIVQIVYTYLRFEKEWSKMTRNSIDSLKKHLQESPEINNKPIPKFNSIRKLRWNLKTNKASDTGDARIINAYIDSTNVIALLTCYPKSEQEDLSDNQYKKLQKFVKALEKEGS